VEYKVERSTLIERGVYEYISKQKSTGFRAFDYPGT